MNRLLLRKYMNESMLLFGACSLMLIAFCWIRVWIVCQFDLQQFAPLLKQFKPFERFSPVPLEQFLTYAGSLAMTFHEPVLILCVIVWSVSRGSDVVSGELSRGTLEMLLSQPVGRGRLMLVHATICIAGLALLCFLAWFGIYAGIHTNSIKETVTPTAEFRLPFTPLEIPVPIGESTEIVTPLSARVSPSIYVLPALNLFAFGFLLLGYLTMLSCFDRYRWRTIGIGIGTYVVQLLLFLLGKATAFTWYCQYLSFFSLYQPDAMVQLVKDNPEAAYRILGGDDLGLWDYSLGPFGMSLALIVLGCIFYWVGWRRFRVRDLPAPL